MEDMMRIICMYVCVYTCRIYTPSWHIHKRNDSRTTGRLSSSVTVICTYVCTWYTHGIIRGYTTRTHTERFQGCRPAHIRSSLHVRFGVSNHFCATFDQWTLLFGGNGSRSRGNACVRVCVVVWEVVYVCWMCVDASCMYCMCMNATSVSFGCIHSVFKIRTDIDIHTCIHTYIHTYTRT